MGKVHQLRCPDALPRRDDLSVGLKLIVRAAWVIGLRIMLFPPCGVGFGQGSSCHWPFTARHKYHECVWNQHLFVESRPLRFRMMKIDEALKQLQNTRVKIFHVGCLMFGFLGDALGDPGPGATIRGLKRPRHLNSSVVITGEVVCFERNETTFERNDFP